jgi:hypothetical protein
MSSEKKEKYDFYLNVKLSDVENKIWFDHVKIFSHRKFLSEEALEELKVKVKEDMPTIADYLKKENKQKIMRTIVEGVTDWRNAFDEFYKFKGCRNQTPEQEDLVTKKNLIYDKVYRYWQKIGKECFADFPE